MNLFKFFCWTDQLIGQSDNNIFFLTEGEDYRIEIQALKKSWEESIKEPVQNLTFSQWQEMGYDRNSKMVDPLFVDPANDDYRLKPESPALKLGFVPIDISKIGIRTRNKDKSFVSEILSQNH